MLSLHKAGFRYCVSWIHDKPWSIASRSLPVFTRASTLKCKSKHEFSVAQGFSIGRRGGPRANCRMKRRPMVQRNVLSTSFVHANGPKRNGRSFSENRKYSGDTRPCAAPENCYHIGSNWVRSTAFQAELTCHSKLDSIDNIKNS